MSKSQQVLAALAGTIVGASAVPGFRENFEKALQGLPQQAQALALVTLALVLGWATWRAKQPARARVPRRTRK